MIKKKSEIQIFLAHASEDKPAVLQLYNRLKQAGYKPWLDKKDLIPGQNWREEIPKAIKASQIFLACLSANSAKQGYIQRELRIALDILGEMLPGTIFFIPMRLEECEIPDLRLAEVGLNLRDIHRLDYWEEDGFEQLERAITHQFNPEPEKPKQLLSVFNFEVVGV
ncbi:MAG: toll/interleukin-1 receptor domain-containing protein, partial [Microcystis sp.]